MIYQFIFVRRVIYYEFLISIYWFCLKTEKFKHYSEYLNVMKVNKSFF